MYLTVLEIEPGNRLIKEYQSTLKDFIEHGKYNSDIMHHSSSTPLRISIFLYVINQLLITLS